MGRKLPTTPRSKVRACLRQLWLRSRERAKALKDSGYRCTDCGVKQSVAKGREVKMEVHHEPPIGDKWEMIIDLIMRDILQAPQVPVCKNCHKLKHEKDSE